MEIFEQIAELRAQIENLVREERELKEGRGTISEGYHDPISDQTYGSGDYLGDPNVEGRLGEISVELSNLRKKLAELERLQTNNMQKPNMQKPEVSAYGSTPTQAHMSPPAFDVKADKKIAEKERLYTFRKVRKSYRKGGNKFDKFLDFITGRSPKWGQIKRYDQAALEHLLSTYHGDTKTTRESRDSIKRGISFGNKKNQVTPDELDRRIADSNWRTFTRLLRHRYQLKQDMEVGRRRG